MINMKNTEGMYKFILLFGVFLVVVPGSSVIIEPMALGEAVRPGYQVDHQPQTAENEIVNEHESNLEVIPNTNHEAPAFQLFHNNHPEIIDSNPKMHILPTQSTMNLTHPRQEITNPQIEVPEHLPELPNQLPEIVHSPTTSSVILMQQSATYNHMTTTIHGSSTVSQYKDSELTRQYRNSVEIPNYTEIVNIQSLAVTSNSHVSSEPEIVHPSYSPEIPSIQTVSVLNRVLTTPLLPTSTVLKYIQTTPSDHILQTSSHFVEPRQTSIIISSACGLLCLLTRSPNLKALSTSRYPVTTTIQISHPVSSIIFPSVTQVSLPTEATGIILNKHQVETTVPSIRGQHSTDPSTRFQLIPRGTTFFTRKTIATSPRSPPSEATPRFSDTTTARLISLGYSSRNGTTSIRPPQDLIPITQSASNASSTHLPEILHPMTQRSSSITPTSLSTRHTKTILIPITQQISNVTSLSSIARQTERPEILIPITESTSAITTQTSTSSTSANLTNPVAILPHEILTPYTNITRSTTKRVKYRSKDYTFVLMTSSSRIPLSTTMTSTARRPTTTRIETIGTTATRTSSSFIPTHPNSSINRNRSPTFTISSTSHPTTNPISTVIIGLIGSSTKLPATTISNIKLFTDIVTTSSVMTTKKKAELTSPSQNSWTTMTETRSVTQNPQILATANGSGRITNIARTTNTSNHVFTSSGQTTRSTNSTIATLAVMEHNVTHATNSTTIVTMSRVTNQTFTNSNISSSNFTSQSVPISMSTSVSLSPRNIPPVFVTVRLRMSWSTFCLNVQSFQRELVDILEANYRDSFKKEQIMIMNKQITYCIEPWSVAEEAEILVRLYIVDYNGQYDSSLTVDCAQYIINGFHEESFFKDKLLKVSLDTADANQNKHEVLATGRPSDHASSADSGITIAVTIATVGGFCCIGVIILQILMRRRYRKSRVITRYGRRRFSIRSNDSIALASVKTRPNSGLFNPALNILEISRFINHNGNLTNPINFAGLTNLCADLDSIYEEFYAISNEMPRLSSVPKGAEDKNRYANVIPTPKTRVSLKRKVSQANSDYINANFITGYPDESKAFIATQAPLPNTKSDFWRMVWEQQSRVIVMLTAMDEHGHPKCCEYWPDSPDNVIKYGDFTVSLKKKDVTQEFILSTLELKDLENNLIREIKHVWYTSWSTKGLPEPVSLVKFVFDIRCLYEDSGGPLVVHCSPGTGRTGTLLAIDICTRQYEADQVTDILKCVSKMRKERAGVVQTKEQYALIYQALNEYALFVNSPPCSAASSVMTLHQIRY